MTTSVDATPGAGPSWATDGYRRLMAELAPIGRDEATGGYNRLSWTPADLALRDWFRATAVAAGLDVVEDGNGNLWGWWGRDTPGTAVVVGSHLDSVPDGGAFDGPVGVVGALLAVQHLREQGFTPGRPVAVVAFADEEGGRFGVACAGSRLLTGALTVDAALRLRDRAGVTMAEAVRECGRDPQGVGADPALLASIGVFVELHIEQGHFPVDGSDAEGLSASGSVLGVGTEIWPHGRWRIDVEGAANHAGATRMTDRSDPLLPAATAVLAVDRAAREHDALGTVGRLEVVPGAVNAIANTARLWMDVRAATEEQVRAVVASAATASGQTAVQESWTPSTPFDADLREAVASAAAKATGAEVPSLPCGAGHDAGVLSLAGVPTAMLFVRNETGVSHAPRESVTADDAAVGILALEAVVRALA